MECCATCFGDRGLRNSIIPLRSTQVGQCSYCGSAGVPVLPPAQLAEYFELVVSAYSRDPKGKLLVQWFREDWGLFEQPHMEDSRAGDLLAEILDDREIVRETFSPAYNAKVNRLVTWETLRTELMSQNRFFPEADIDRERLELLLSNLIIGVDEVPRLWYRARIQADDNPFDIAHMGAPPSRIASHGRANPAGIPYLYLGSTDLTSISEIRPHAGELVCVATFETPGGLELIDLRSPRKMVSPFLLEDAEDICRMRDDLPFLERLGDELTRPVVPQAAAIDYTPSQYLCEFIKKCGYSGVVYRSSVSEGINLALFNPAAAAPGTVSQYLVNRVRVEARPVHA